MSWSNEKGDSWYIARRRERLSILLIFVFEHRVDGALRLVGYEEKFVSCFPFIRNMYFPLATSNKLGGIDIAHFHLLDFALWLTIAVWGIWLAVGIFLLNHYDRGLSRLSELYRGRWLQVYLSWIFLLGCPVIMSIPLRTPLYNPELLFVLRHAPRFYFFTIAFTYYLCGGFLLTFLILLLIWNVFRKNRNAPERAQEAVTYTD